MQTYPVFEDKLSEDNFLSRIVGLGEENGGNVLRASTGYLDSQKCAHCNQNVAMILLVFAVEAMKYRKGNFERFKKFLLDYCPNELRKVPTEEYEFPFDEALNHIYRKFRNPYVHEAVPFFPAQEKKNNIQVTAFQTFIYGRHLIFIEYNEFFKWFSSVVKVSLYKYLIQVKQTS
jgi:hypothetical protein